MAGLHMPRKSLIFKYKNHTFYIDNIYPDMPWVHIDPKGKEIDSYCFDENDVIEYINNYNNGLV